MAAHPSPALSRFQPALARLLAGDTHQGCFATDAGFRVVLWNRWMELHTGHGFADVQGRSLFELYPEALARGVNEYYEHALEGKVTVVSHKLHRYLLAMPPTNPDLASGEMPQSARIAPLSDGDAVVGTMTIIEDVSERLAAELELRRQIDAHRLARVTAEQALRAKDDFLSILSHEIRTPLNAVLGWVRILLGREEIDHDLLMRALRVIERNATAQARMIDDMLDLARVVAGKLRLDMQPVDLRTVVLAAVDVVLPAATAKRVELRTMLHPKVPPVYGDPDRLQQVMWNLLSNALKFTDAEGSVDVRLESDGRFARIVVRDTGQGITPDFLPHVFERFHQDDLSGGRQGGLGLGLALVRELVELHGGSVRAASDGYGKGATFMIELPVAV